MTCVRGVGRRRLLEAVNEPAKGDRIGPSDASFDQSRKSVSMHPELLRSLFGRSERFAGEYLPRHPAVERRVTASYTMPMMDTTLFRGAMTPAVYHERLSTQPLGACTESD
jgi:hypothetical protein